MVNVKVLLKDVDVKENSAKMQIFLKYSLDVQELNYK